MNPPGYHPSNRPQSGPRWRFRLYEVIFHAEDPLAKGFDLALIVAILASVLVVMLDSVEPVADQYHELLLTLEWVFTVLFTAEYVLRLVAVHSKRRYALSFFGVVDLFSILPTYVSLFFPGTQSLTVLRVLRVLRVFRVLKLVQYMGEARILGKALVAARYKITVFLITVLSLVVILGSLMFLVEGPASGFTSIPMAVYWAIVTLTTVGFGDITPQSAVGQFLAAVIMLLGYAIIAVPTGIMSVEIAQASAGVASASERGCLRCGKRRHEKNASFCSDCGQGLPPVV